MCLKGKSGEFFIYFYTKLFTNRLRIADRDCDYVTHSAQQVVVGAQIKSGGGGQSANLRALKITLPEN